jgi:Ala-tRNA(Pro) deacylase
MPLVRRLKECLEKAHIAFKTEQHSVAYTAQEVAEITHVRGQEVVKTVVVVADGKHVLVALPATRKIDIPVLREALGVASVRLAGEEEFKDDFPDCDVGAMPPFGSLYNLRLVASEALREDEEIVFNAGTHRDVVRMKRADWQALEKPEWAAFTKPAA